MLRDLRQICERPGDAEAEDFRAAARSLLERQFLLLERPRDRDSYRLVANHFDYYTNLFDALGWTLHRDDTFGLIGLMPSESEGFARLRLVDSLMLLCLRLLYEEGMERFEAQEGSIYTQSETLLGRYEALLGRKRPLLSEYREVLVRLRRYSLIETGAEADDGLPGLRILPTIRLITGERVQERFAAFLDASEDEPVDSDDGDGITPGEDDPSGGEADP
jgi:hypothetical protein